MPTLKSELKDMIYFEAFRGFLFEFARSSRNASIFLDALSESLSVGIPGYGKSSSGDYLSVDGFVSSLDDSSASSFSKASSISFASDNISFGFRASIW